MTSTVSMTHPHHDDHPAGPDELPEDERLARLFSARLTAAGLPATRQPRRAGRPVRTTAPDGAVWWLEVDTVQMVLHRDAAPAGQAPRRLADLAAVLLTGEPVAGRPDLDFDPADHTLKGAVGRDLKLRGFRVDLWTSVDDVAFEVFGEVRATNPDSDDRRTLYVADDGSFICYFETCVGRPTDVIITNIADTLTTAFQT
jgi:hypothetical protein